MCHDWYFISNYQKKKLEWPGKNDLLTLIDLIVAILDCEKKNIGLILLIW